MSPVALVTGAATGLGRETAKQLAAKGWQVVLTALNPADAEREARGIASELELAADRIISFGPLDATQADRARAAAAFVETQTGRIDALVNNAAIISPSDSASILDVPVAEVARTIDNNAMGALTVTQAFAPLLRKTRGCVVMVSSGMGATTSAGSTFAGYRSSKAVLNTLTRMLHVAFEGSGVRVNAVCPGHVKTPFGGPHATREVPEGARGIVWAATLDDTGPSGGFFRDGEPIDW